MTTKTFIFIQLALIISSTKIKNNNVTKFIHQINLVFADNFGSFF